MFVAVVVMLGHGVLPREEDRHVNESYQAAQPLIQVRHDQQLRGEYQYDFAGRRVWLRDAHNYGAQQLISRHDATEGTLFYHHDALSSVVALSTTQGHLQARYQYNAWGEPRDTAGSSSNRFGFTGQQRDDDTGLYYFKARFYDPALGRFISEDSFLGDTSSPPSLHRYTYAQGNPLLYNDPSGHESVTTMIDNSAEGCGPVTCAFYAAGQAFYQVGTLGFASVHDPVRDAYDNDQVGTGEYIAKGIGGGTAAVGVTVATGRVATPFLLAANSTRAAVAISATAGAIDGAAVDAITQATHISAGIQNEYDIDRTVKSAALGGVLGGGVAGGTIAAKQLSAKIASARKNNAVRITEGSEHATLERRLELLADSDLGSLNAPTRRPGVAKDANPAVTARASVNGQVFVDVNQTARVGGSAEQMTLISEQIAGRQAATGKVLPNGNMVTAHAEIGAIQQAFEAGATSGADMTLTVTGKLFVGIV